MSVHEEEVLRLRYQRSEDRATELRRELADVEADTDLFWAAYEKARGGR